MFPAALIAAADVGEIAIANRNMVRKSPSDAVRRAVFKRQTIVDDPRGVGLRDNVPIQRALYIRINLRRRTDGL